MMHYQVRCSRDHEFDGWFKDSAAFDRQTSLGLIECPTCGDKAVTRAIMAPALASRPRSTPIAPPSPQATPDAKTPATPQPTGAVAGPMPDHLRAMLQRLRNEVERNCDYVGPQFADEARKMHRGESDRRGIYGETTPTEAESLADEGIEVSRIPWVPRADG
ncbi:MAG TPA: DUF1178 family protein [Acetobacteraceae bacterium]|nr:DUF1178 family protein [Acetobacteraceae bacterium]